MIGEARHFNEEYAKLKENNNLFGNAFELNKDLEKYINIIPKADVLDLGIGEGKNSLQLAKEGFNVTGVDITPKALEICKDNATKYNVSLNLYNQDIRNFNIEKDKYSLIMSSNVLYSMHKKDAKRIIENMKNNLLGGGLIFVQFYSKDEPNLRKQSLKVEYKICENYILQDTQYNRYYSYYTKEEVLDLFKGFTTLYIADSYDLDMNDGNPQYHGVITYIGRKKKNTNYFTNAIIDDNK